MSESIGSLQSRTVMADLCATETCSVQILAEARHDDENLSCLPDVASHLIALTALTAEQKT